MFAETSSSNHANRPLLEPDGATADPCGPTTLRASSPPRCGPHSGLIMVATSVASIAAVFGVAVALAPSAEAICHRLNLSTPDGQPCVENVEGLVCPSQARDCEVLSEESWIIQGTECLIIGFLLLCIWWLEAPRRHHLQFIADNSKSILLALTTHFLVVIIAAILGDVTHAECVDGLHPGAQPCDWYLVTFLLDDFVAVPLTLGMYVASARAFARSRILEPLSRIGDYEAPVDPSSGVRPASTNEERLKRWGAQVLHWICCALISRSLETLLIFLLLQPLLRVANLAGWWACSEQEVLAKQWIHLMVLPILLDVLQFTVQNWVFDGRQHLTTLSNNEQNPLETRDMLPDAQTVSSSTS